MNALLDDSGDEVLRGRKWAPGKVGEELWVGACDAEERVSVLRWLQGIQISSFNKVGRGIAYDEWNQFHAIILQIWRYGEAEVEVVRRRHIYRSWTLFRWWKFSS